MNCNFELVEKKFLSGIISNKKLEKIEKWRCKMKMKNRLLVELCYNYHFHRSDSSIFDIFRLNEYFWNFFYSGDDPRLKNHSCENGNYSKILQEVDFFFIFIFHFFPIFLFDNVPLKYIFSTSTKSQFNSNSIKSYSLFCLDWRLI